MTRKRIDPAKLKRGPIRHEELPLSLVARINYLRSTLHEVHPMSIEEWLDGFRRDLNPESEVRSTTQKMHLLLDTEILEFSCNENEKGIQHRVTE